MKQRNLSVAILALGLLGTMAGATQENGNWRASSSTAKSVTGDIVFYNQRIGIDLSNFIVAQIRTLKPEELTALFSSADPADIAKGTGNLFRTDIPGDKRFLHKNTLCGSENTQWVATFVSGHNLQLAFLSGPKMPTFTPEFMANTTELCGTYSYVK